MKEDFFLPRTLPVDYKGASVDDQSRLDAVALEIARFRGKTGVIQYFTGWRAVRARELYTTVTGRRPPSGGGYATSAALLRHGPRIHIHVTLFSSTLMGLTNQRNAEGDQPLYGERFVEAYRIYLDQVLPNSALFEPLSLIKTTTKRTRRNTSRQTHLTINDAALVARDMVAQAGYLTFCARCHAHYYRLTEAMVGQLLQESSTLRMSDIARITSCPICAMRKNWKSKRSRNICQSQDAA